MRLGRCIAVLLLVASACVAGCDSGGGSGEGDALEPLPGELNREEISFLPEPKRLVYELDLFAREDLASDKFASAEVLEWIKDPEHTSLLKDNRGLTSFAEEFYDAGAEVVYAARITELTREALGFQVKRSEVTKTMDTATVLIVELPVDVVDRKAVLLLAYRYLDEWYEEEYSTIDYGQTYIRFPLL